MTLNLRYQYEPVEIGTRSEVSSADNSDEATFAAAVSAFISKADLLLVSGSFSVSGANCKVRIAYYSVTYDENDTEVETFIQMSDVQAINASSQTKSSRYLSKDNGEFAGNGYTKIRLFIESISSGNVTLKVEKL